MGLFPQAIQPTISFSEIIGWAVKFTESVESKGEMGCTLG